MKKKQLWVALALSGLITLNATYGGEREDLVSLRATTQALIDALVQKGVITPEAAKAMIQRAEQKGRDKAAEAEPTEPGPDVVRVPYIPETVKREIRDELRTEVLAEAKNDNWGDLNAVPDWVHGLKWEGDLRLRYEGEFFSSGNAPPYQFQSEGVNLTDTSQDTSNFRLRARLGLLAQVNDTVSTGFRITTGNTSNPVSTNQTMGNTQNKYSLVLDLAYAKLTPSSWFNISGGRIPNPFFSTDLVWADDLNFEGVAANFSPWANTALELKPFLTVGAFPLEYQQPSPTDLAENKWMYAAQAGLDWRISDNTRSRFGLAYYDYVHVAGVENPTPALIGLYANSAPQFVQKGNSLYVIDNNNGNAAIPPIWGLAADYRLLDLTASMDLAQFAPTHVILGADVVKNIGYDANAVASRLGVPGYQARTLGYLGKVTVGMPTIKNQDDWQLYFGYKHLGRDATLDAFPDPDFDLGGTNAKGYFLGGRYGTGTNSWLSMKWLSADTIDGLQFNVDVLQVDFNAAF
ncbi:MAG: putative porin [Thiobacillaceae bacterium]